MSIGAHFSKDEEAETLQRGHARQWIRSAQGWRSDIRCTHFPTISGLQAYCLVVLSLQFNHGNPDRIWLAQGVLQRTANYMGLHRDPNHFRKCLSTMLKCDSYCGAQFWS